MIGQRIIVAIKIVLRKNYQKKDGTFPIALRLTKDRKTKFLYTGEYILERHWGEIRGLAKKTYPNSVGFGKSVIIRYIFLYFTVKRCLSIRSNIK